MVTVWTVLAILAVSSAHAVVVTESKGSNQFGVQVRAALFSQTKPAPHEPLQYHGGPVVPASNTYAIYWDPVGAYRSDWMGLIDHYLYDVGADSGKLTNVFSLNSQYTGLAGTRAAYNDTFRGAYTDTAPYPPSECAVSRAPTVCLTDKEIREQLKQFVYVNGLPYGLDTVYYVLTPPGVSVCTEQAGPNRQCSESVVTTEEEEEEEGADKSTMCGYHSAIDATSVSPIVYAVQPWTGGNAGSVPTSSVVVNTTNATEAVLDCQNTEILVEPNQTGKRSAFADYETGLADVIINDLSVEQNNTVTDPLLNGWNEASSGVTYEASDICQHTFNPPPEQLPKVPPTTKAMVMSDETINGDHYYVQWGFNSTRVAPNENLTCWEGTELAPHFTAPNPVNVNDIVAFDASESAMALAASKLGFSLLTPAPSPMEEPFTEPSYKWEFGDGTPTVSSMGTEHASVFHSYQYGGVYTVTLTVTDSGGNVAKVSEKITVNGPPAPGQGSTPASGAASPTGASGGAGGGASTGMARPVVYDFFPSHSLTKVLSQGLAVRYAVNEQVAGSMEVMLDLRTARRLHIHGPLAKGLPEGYAREVVLRGAVLVTTMGGHGTLRVKFPKPMAEKLAKANRLKLTVRIKVRNADRVHPQTSTLLSTLVLKV